MTNELEPAPSAPEPWNHNVHYHRLILAAVPLRCARALDVGCGQGALTRLLRRVVPQVAGIDRDERSIALARAHPGATGISYVLGDFLQAPLDALPFEPGTVDLITAVASLHHMDDEAALRRMAELLRPGGVLVVIGLARESSLTGLSLNIPAFFALRAHWVALALAGHGAGRRAQAYQSPIVWPPRLTYRQVRQLARRVLPGALFRRRLYWRYSLLWTKP